MNDAGTGGPSGVWPDPTFVTDPIPDGTFADLRPDARVRRPAAPVSGAEIEKVLVLWDGSEPGEGELAALVRRLAPGYGADGMRLEVGKRPGVSRALAAWHVLQDEQKGELAPGAPSRLRQLLADDSPRGKRLVTVVKAPGRHRPQATPHASEYELILRHAARIELEARPEYLKLPAWSRMLGPDCLGFVAGDDPYPLRFGPFPSRVREFGDLTVAVTLAGTRDPARIRDQLPGGYFGAFDALVRDAGIRLGESTVAHWTRCDDNGNTAAHLSFLPPRGLPVLMAWELLSAEERKRGNKIS
ncbi:hypothetical protein [Amycolatopsis minnesotensis]